MLDSIGRRRIAILVLASFAVATVMSGCASQPETMAEEVPLTVWPKPPEQARIQYVGELKSFASVRGPRKKSLRDRLLGAETEIDIALSKPYGVHSDARGRVFVADTGIAGLVVFDEANKTVETWGTSGLGQLTQALGVTSDSAGRVYVTDGKDRRVVVFDAEGDYVLAMGGKEHLSRPAGIVVNDELDRVYVVDVHKHQLIVFDREGNYIESIGERGPEPGQFNLPTNIAIDADGRLYVADSMNFRIQILEPDGSVVNTIGTLGDNPGELARLKGVGVDTYGHIYAVDASFNNFQIFDQEGNLLLVVGSAGRGPGGFHLPAGAHVDANNRILVSDQYNQRIQIFQYLGEPAKSPETDSPAPVIDGSGDGKPGS